MLTALRVGKIFGFFPININSKQPHEIVFKWKNYCTIISMIFMAWSLWTAVCTLKTQFEAGPLTPANIVGVIFFSVCFTISLIFFGIAQKFKSLLMFWTKVERVFMHEKYEFDEKKWKLKKRLNVLMWTFLTGALLEHLFYLSAEIYKLNFEITYCNLTKTDPIKMFITKHLNFVINCIPISYNHAFGIVVEFFNFSLTFWWNYLDLFIVLVSIGLSELYDRITYRIKCMRTVPLKESVWEELRQDHTELSELVILVNEIFGLAFIVACCNDGYFILIQMLNITT